MPIDFAAFMMRKTESAAALAPRDFYVSKMTRHTIVCGDRETPSMRAHCWPLMPFLCIQISGFAMFIIIHFLCLRARGAPKLRFLLGLTISFSGYRISPATVANLFTVLTRRDVCCFIIYFTVCDKIKRPFLRKIFYYCLIYYVNR